MTSKWTKRSLAELCELFTDGEWVETKDQSPNGVRLIQTGNVGEGRFKDRKAKARFISSETFARRKCEEVLPGDCLVSRLPDPVGRACIIPETGETMITAVDCTIMRFKEPLISPQFFIYYSQSKKYLDEVESLCTGATRKRISRKNLGKVTIDLPLIWEQKRIVAILDEAFEGIDAAIANTEKNLANARELFESYLNFMFNPRGEGWIEKPLAEFVTSISTGPFGSLLHKSDYVSDGVPLVNPINIVGSKVIPDNKKMVGDDTKERLGAYILKAGDIALARRGEIGRCAVIENAQDGWVCGTGCFFIRPGKHVNPHFMGHLFRSTRYRKELERISSGATMLNLSNKALSDLMVVLPEIREQERLVNRISELLAQCQKVEDIYRQKLEGLAELKQSLLQKAFTGELTAENMENEAREAVI